MLIQDVNFYCVDEFEGNKASRQANVKQLTLTTKPVVAA